MCLERNRNPQSVDPDGAASGAMLMLAVNLHRWRSGGRQDSCSLTYPLAPDKVEVVVGYIAQEEERAGRGCFWAVRHRNPALYPAPSRVAELVAALNAYSLPIRRGRWLRVWSSDDSPPGHVVVFWDADGRPVTSPDGELRCTCGLPVTITATDVLCASGHPIDAAI